MTNNDSTTFDSGTEAPYTVSALCPTGQVAVGGGGNATIESNEVVQVADLARSHPIDDGSGWNAGFSPADGQNFTTTEQLDYTVFVICVDGTTG